MAMKSVCPKCGSIKVRHDYLTADCLEPDCGHSGKGREFRPEHTQQAENIHNPRPAWRDPVAMSMDGYDE